MRAERAEEAVARSDGGFSLTETMVSLTILTTALLGMASTAVQVGAAMNTVQVRTSALAEARGQLEQLLSEPYAELSDGSAESAGVSMSWTVSEATSTKEIVLEYQYAVADEVRVDTISAGRRGT